VSSASGAHERFSRLLELTRLHYEGKALVFEDFIDQSGAHPGGYRHFECGFAADQIRRLRPDSIIDIGSNRIFLAGLLAAHSVTTVDIRSRAIVFTGETAIECNGSAVPVPDESFDIVISLNAIEHFGLGRYGDPFDLKADQKAFVEWRRILRPGGHVVFSTTINRSGDAVAFNAHRIYSRETIYSFCAELTCVQEAFFCNSRRQVVAFEELGTNPRNWDVYAGCWARQ
jgi:SAM-dependent methyltransferase